MDTLISHLRNGLCETPCRAREAKSGCLCAEAAAEIERLQQALRDVQNPLAMLQRKAEADGLQLSGMAYSIATDLHFVQSIARDALNPSS